MRLEKEKLAGLLIGGLTCFCVLLFLNWYWHRNSTFYNFLFNPENYWTPLITADLDLTSLGSSITDTVYHQYPGLYSISLNVENPIPVAQPYDTDFELNFSFTQGDEVILSYKGEHLKTPFWSAIEGESGITILSYYVPEDIPIREEMKFSVVVYKSDQNFKEKYGDTDIQIRKLSDE